jgi:Na+:H+ antiporter, NhaC family
MDLIIVFSITFILLIFSIYKDIFVAYPLMVGFILFFCLALKRGYPFKDILIMSYKGGKKSLVVLKIFLLIGAITAIWMSSGTVPAIVYYGVKLIRPNIFILSAFIICCFVSFLIGTSFGTVGTVGIALIAIARGGGINIGAASGAIIAGAYFGDRCSPMSSSASLVASTTETNIYDNMKNMLKTGLVPFILSIIFYTAISLIFPLNNSTSSINSEILKTFNVNLVVLFPALVIMIFSLFKINIKISMLASIITATLLSIFIQHYTLLNCISFMISGYSLDKSAAIYSIIKGGGILSMLKTAVVIIVASSLAGLFEGTKMFESIEALTNKANSRYEVYRNVIMTSIVTSAFGCSQVIAVILTHMLNKKAYIKNHIDSSNLAIDLENTAIIISPLIPWNIALLVPMTNLGTNFICIPYLFYLYILPIWCLIYFKFKKKSS